MRRPLDAPIAPAPLPSGMILLPFDKGVAHAARELLESIYPDGLGDGGIDFEGFWTWLTGDPEFDSSLMFVAAEGRRVVGFCHCWSGGFVKDLAVDPTVRNRGVGTALLTLALSTFALRGLASVELKTEVSNDKAQSLYRRLGFEIVERLD